VSGNVSGSTITSSAFQFTDGHFVYYDGSGHGVKVRSISAAQSLNPITSALTAITPNIQNYSGPLETAEQLNFSYAVNGNVVNKTVDLKTSANVANGTQSDSTTVVYDDGHGAFYTGTYSKNYPNGAVDNGTYTGSNIRLTPLTLAMLAGRTISLAAPGCPNGVTTLIFNSTGTQGTSSNCGGEIATFAAATNVPGLLIKTSPLSVGSVNDGSILYMGLDGLSVAVGSSLVFVTANNGYVQSNGADYPAWGTFPIVSVK
jgi:phage baseplate assembly protein gpV